MASTLVPEIPAPLRIFFSKFPLYLHHSIPSPSRFILSDPTIWILPPRNPDIDLLSSDVECLKWQAYLALRGLTGISVRCNVAPEGGIDGRLPNLHVPLPEDREGKLLPAHMIPEWVDTHVEDSGDPLEGYKDEASKDESHAWVSLLEGNVHAALALSQPKTFSLLPFITSDPSTTRPIQTLTAPPPAPTSGLSSLLPPYGVHISISTIELQYREAIASLSERLSTDRWFLGSETPTALDALVFAYLHCLLHSPDNIRIEVTRRVNLVAWERRVRTQVRSAFQLNSSPA